MSPGASLIQNSGTIHLKKYPPSDIKYPHGDSAGNIPTEILSTSMEILYNGNVSMEIFNLYGDIILYYLQVDYLFFLQYVIKIWDLHCQLEI